MARCRHRHARRQRTLLQLYQLHRAQVYAHGEAAREFNVGIHPHLGPRIATGRHRAGGQCCPTGWLDIGCTQLHAADTRSQRASQVRQPAGLVILGRGRHQIAVGLPQGGDHGTVGRRHRVAAKPVHRHPCKGLTFAATQGAAPMRDHAHIQLQTLVRIRLRHGDERGADLDLNPEFLVQFAHQRGFRRLAGLALATGKLPQTGEVAALRAPRQQHAAASIADDPGDDFDDRLRACVVGCRGFWLLPLLAPRGGFPVKRDRAPWGASGRRRQAVRQAAHGSA